MPAALERKLKAKVAGKDWSEKKKNAYVYGTLRNTGWKPSTQMSLMDQKLIRLAQIDDKLDSIIRFDYGDYEEQRKKSLVGSTLKTGALVGAGVGGTIAHQAVMGSGGYRSNWNAGRIGYDLSKRGIDPGGTIGNTGYKIAGAIGAPQTGKIGYGIGSALGTPGKTAGKVAGAAQKGLGSVAGKMRNVFSPQMLAKLHLWESREKPIQFDEHLLEPTSGGQFGQVPSSKIIQEDFPAGPNPGYAEWAKNLSREEMLKLPFPQLMKFLNQRNILQQVFNEKLERLIELNSKLDEINLESDTHPRSNRGYKIKPLVGNVYHDEEGNLYTHREDVKKNSDILNYPHLQHGQFVKIVNKSGRPTYESRTQAKAIGAIGGGIAGAGVGGLAGLGLHAAMHGKIGAGVAAAGPIAGAAIGYRYGSKKILPQDRAFNTAYSENEIQFREDRSGKTWKGALGAGAVAAGGYGIYKAHPIKRYQIGKEAAQKNLNRLSKRLGTASRFYDLQPSHVIAGDVGKAVKSGVRAAWHARLSSNLDDILEFKFKDKDEDDKPGMKFKKFKKGRKSHGGGT